MQKAVPTACFSLDSDGLCYGFLTYSGCPWQPDDTDASKRNSDYSMEFSPGTETTGGVGVGGCAGFPGTVWQDDVIVESAGRDRDTKPSWVLSDS